MPRRNRQGPNLLAPVITPRTAHLPVQPCPELQVWPNAARRPQQGKPVPRRATERRVPPQIPTHPTEVPIIVTPRQSSRRALPLHHRKRNRPTWSPTPTSNQQTMTEPRTKNAPDFGHMAQAQGKRLMAPSACVNFHSFSETLQEWEMGVPVDCGEPWTWETVEAAGEKGAHKSVGSLPKMSPTKYEPATPK
jgi:hypothetical protein